MAIIILCSLSPFVANILIYWSIWKIEDRKKANRIKSHLEVSKETNGVFLCDTRKNKFSYIKL